MNKICFDPLTSIRTSRAASLQLKRESKKGVVFFAMSCRKSKKMRLIYELPGVNGLRDALHG